MGAIPGDLRLAVRVVQVNSPDPGRSMSWPRGSGVARSGADAVGVIEPGYERRDLRAGTE